MIPFMITVTLMTVIFIFGLVVFLITIQKRQHRKSREYLQDLVAEKDRTMQLISLEVHDNVNQMLNLVHFNLFWMKNNPAADHVSLVKQTSEMVNTLILDTNNIAHTLNTEYLKEKGLINSMKEEVRWVNESKKIDCKLFINGITRKFEPQVEVTVFRIAQEAINNVIKHAEADIINIAMAYEKERFSMVVSDNGKGFDYGNGRYKKSVGMSSMSRRAIAVNGQLSIESSLGNGTNVLLDIPYADQSAIQS